MNIGRFVAIILLLCVMLLSACGSHTYHVVRPGDTLYSIGWAYGYDYKQIANWNDIDQPYAINEGQIIRFSKTDAAKKTNQVGKNSKVSLVSLHEKSRKTQKPKNNPINSRKLSASNKKRSIKNISWKWPTTSKNVVQYFSPYVKSNRVNDKVNKGLNIAGRRGSSIKAAAAGRVVYSGSGLIGYGRLIIIKHNDSFLSAYAHNKEILVKEGEQIKLGQRIATMGSSGTNRVILHFEIRRNGQPVNPLKFLPKHG